MTLRIVPSIISANTTFNVQQRNGQLLKLQQQISSGLKIQRPSDDPYVHSQIKSLHQQVNLLATEAENIALAETGLNLSLTHLQDVNSLLVQAKQIALQGSQALDQGERNAYATELDHLIQRLFQSANASDGGEFHFSGAATQQTPFELSESSYPGQLRQVAYLGSTVETQTVVSASITVSTQQDGSRIFLRESRGETLFLGDTGAAAGTGTDSGIGSELLQVEHLVTTYSGTSGLTNGASSLASDTVIGGPGVHSVEIIDTVGDGSAGTISLNGGVAINFTNSDTNLAVSGPYGEKVFVDTTSITAGFSGTVDLTATGRLSTDGGNSFVAIDFSTNQVVENSFTGKVTNIDSSGIFQAGIDHVEYTDTADAFTTLIELRNDIVNGRDLNHDEHAAALQRRIGDLDAIANQIFKAMGQVSADSEDLQILKQRNEDVQFELKTLIAGKESVDYAEVATQMQQALNLLEYTYASSSSILNQSILNYL